MKFHVSKKVATAVIGAIVVAINSALDSPIPDDQVTMIAGVIVAYLVSQGIADHGAQGAAKAAERAIKRGGYVAEAVSGALAGKRSVATGPVQEVHDDEDGPDWSDTSEMDAEDSPRNLNG